MTPAGERIAAAIAAELEELEQERARLLETLEHAPDPRPVVWAELLEADMAIIDLGGPDHLGPDHRHAGHHGTIGHPSQPPTA
jgi:hypothetical protein